MAKIRISKRKSYREYIRSLITLSNKFRVDIRKVFDKFKKRFARDFENIQDVDNDTVQSFYEYIRSHGQVYQKNKRYKAN
jgi:hypothetical protein